MEWPRKYQQTRLPVERWLRSRAVIIDRRCCIPTHSGISNQGLQYHGGITETGYEGVALPDPRIPLTFS
jgi:hypothetical protein